MIFGIRRGTLETKLVEQEYEDFITGISLAEIITGASSGEYLL
jgi:hypothetical protein